MGGTNVNQTPTQTTTTSPTVGNLGAGTVLDSSTVMPLDLAGSTGTNSVSITDVSPGVFNAAAAVANNAVTSALQSNTLVTTDALALAGSGIQSAGSLASGVSGSGPIQGLIASGGKIFLWGIGIIFGILLLFWLLVPSRRRKEEE